MTSPAKGKRIAPKHPRASKKPRLTKKKEQRSTMSARARAALTRTALGMAELEARRRDADLSSYSHLPVVTPIGPRKWRGRAVSDGAEEDDDSIDEGSDELDIPPIAKPRKRGGQKGPGKAQVSLVRISTSKLREPKKRAA